MIEEVGNNNNNIGTNNTNSLRNSINNINYHQREAMECESDR